MSISGLLYIFEKLNFSRKYPNIKPSNDIDSEEEALKIIAKENEEIRKQMEEQERIFNMKMNDPNFRIDNDETKIEDWKKYITSYKKEYNADIILIDGRFRVACAFDVFNKIKNDTVVLLHECSRTQYSVIKK